MKKMELLAPAGSLEKMQYLYGGDSYCFMDIETYDQVEIEAARFASALAKDLFFDLAANDDQLGFPVIYASGKDKCDLDKRKAVESI